MHAYYHPRDLWALLDRVAGERAAELDTLCYFNDRRRSTAEAASQSAKRRPRKLV